MKDNIFNINIPAEKYFNELTHMKDQYGQEEDLYPWIYMLLQMAECKKKEQNKKYKSVSIRDVHKAQGAKSLGEKREKVRGITSFPDFVVFNRENTVGCVEIKAINYVENNEQNKELKIKSLIERETIKEFPIYLPTNGIAEKYYLQIGIQHPKRFVEKISISIDKEDYDNFKESSTLELKGGRLIIDNEDFGSCNLDEPKDERLNIAWRKKKTWQYETKISTVLKGNDRPWEMVGHLEKFKNVLYTNGLEFYFLKLENNQIKVDCLADLSEDFKNYHNAPKNERENIVNEIEKQPNSEWKKLIDKLTENIWCE